MVREGEIDGSMFEEWVLKILMAKNENALLSDQRLLMMIFLLSGDSGSICGAESDGA